MYMDTGSLNRVDHLGIANSKGTFSTAFVRPGRLHWKFANAKLSLELWQDGDRVLSGWNGRVEKQKDLGDAIAGYTGLSDEAAIEITSLLVPDQVPGWSLLQLEHLTVLDDAVKDGVDCWRMSGKRRSDSFTVWIGKHDLLIRRIEANKTSARVSTTMDIVPVEGMSIDPAEFEPPTPSLSFRLIAGIVGVVVALVLGSVAAWRHRQ